MMLLESLKDKRIFIARQQQVAGTVKFLAATITSAYMHIQPISDSDAELTEGTFGKTFVFYCDGTVDVQEGDKLRDESNNYYKVRSAGVSRRDFGTFDYKKVIAEKLP